MSDDEILEDPFAEAFIDKILHAVVDEKPRALVHYTTTDGLLGMLDSRQLWFSDARFLSDTSELECGIELMKEAAANREKELDECGFAKTMEVMGLPYPISDYLSKMFGSFYVPYVFCTCENPNVLSQWREYSATEGYAVCFTFDIHRLRPHSLPKSLTSNLVCKVVYEKNGQLDIANRVLSLIISTFQNMREAGTPFGGRRYSEVTSYALRGIIDCVIKFKKQCFSEEREWRVYRWLGPKERVLLKYRNKRGTIVPYLALENPHDDHLLPISTIYYTAAFERKVRERGLRMLCDSRGYDKVELKANDLPPFR